MVDISPVLVLAKHESEGTTLAHYTYTWPAEGDILSLEKRNSPSPFSKAETTTVKTSRQALALGLGSMFNHMRIPNVGWERDIPTLSIRYFTIRDIMEGEELCISYGPKLWFDDADGLVEVESSAVDAQSILSFDVDVFE